MNNVKGELIICVIRCIFSLKFLLHIFNISVLFCQVYFESMSMFTQLILLYFLILCFKDCAEFVCCQNPYIALLLYILVGSVLC